MPTPRGCLAANSCCCAQQQLWHHLEHCRRKWGRTDRRQRRSCLLLLLQLLVLQAGGCSVCRSSSSSIKCQPLPYVRCGSGGRWRQPIRHRVAATTNRCSHAAHSSTAAASSQPSSEVREPWCAVQATTRSGSSPTQQHRCASAAEGRRSSSSNCSRCDTTTSNPTCIIASTTKVAHCATLQGQRGTAVVWSGSGEVPVCYSSAAAAAGLLLERAVLVRAVG